MDALVTKHCTAVHGVPTMFIAMLEHPDFDKYDFRICEPASWRARPAR